VDVDDAVPHLLGLTLDVRVRLERLDADVVEQHIESAEARDRLVEHPPAVGRLRHVGAHEQPVTGRHLADRALAGRLVDLGDRHARALAREGERGGAPDPERATSDYDYLAVEFAHRSPYVIPSVFMPSHCRSVIPREPKRPRDLDHREMDERGVVRAATEIP